MFTEIILGNINYHNTGFQNIIFICNVIQDYIQIINKELMLEDMVPDNDLSAVYQGE